MCNVEEFVDKLFHPALDWEARWQGDQEVCCCWRVAMCWLTLPFMKFLHPIMVSCDLAISIILHDLVGPRSWKGTYWPWHRMYLGIQYSNSWSVLPCWLIHSSSSLVLSRRSWVRSSFGHLQRWSAHSDLVRQLGQWSSSAVNHHFICTHVVQKCECCYAV